MLQMGIPTKYAQERMGHSTPNMLTNVYQHTFQSQQKEYDTILNQFFTQQIAEETKKED